MPTLRAPPLSPPAPASAQTTLGTAAAEMRGAGREAERQGGEHRWGYLAAALGALAIAGGVLVVALGGDDSGEVPGSEASAGSELAVAAPAAVEPAVAAAALAPGARAELPATVKASIATDPPGAAIHRVSDGRRIGTTPFVGEFTRGDGVLELSLQREGYHDQRVTVSLKDDREYVEHLVRKPASPGGGERTPAAEPAIERPKPGRVTAKPGSAKPGRVTAKPGSAKPGPVTVKPEPVTAKPEPAKPEPAKPAPAKPKEKEWGETYDPLAE